VAKTVSNCTERADIAASAAAAAAATITTVAAAAAAVSAAAAVGAAEGCLLKFDSGTLCLRNANAACWCPVYCIWLPN